MKKVLLAGARGQLAKEFIRQLSGTAYHLIAPAEAGLDITSRENVFRAVAEAKPDIILNCAAYNLVDKAEEETALAMRVNAEGPGHLAAAAREHGAFLVHYSTDYVFDGAKQNLYVEEDPVNPINAYGRSKFEGEVAVQKELDRYLIFRTSWVFGAGTQNFLYKLSQWAAGNAVLRLAADQVSVPTYTEDMVRVTMAAIERQLTGLYHLTNSGYASRYEVAKYYLRASGLNNLIIPVGSNEFPSAANRPLFTAMSNDHLSRALNIQIPTWEDAVDRFVKRSDRFE